jgi:hypothetical protein
MRTALTAMCSFTILASTWLFTMFLILRHPGFEWRAALAVGFIAIGVITLAAARIGTPGAALRMATGAGAAALIAAGVWAIRTNVDDGFVDVIGLAFILQSALALVVVARPRPVRRVNGA